MNGELYFALLTSVLFLHL